MQVRKAQTPEDWQSIRDICCMTGNDGAAITQDRWKWFAEVWVSPYEDGFSQNAYVAVDSTGRVQGYLLGCPSQIAWTEFKKQKMSDWIAKTFTGGGLLSKDWRKFMSREMGYSPSPASFFSKEFQDSISDKYPAHLHMNLLADTRGKGVGRKLWEVFRADLLERGTNGIHLYCGANPKPFYEKLGFQCIEEKDFLGKFRVYGMVQSFTSTLPGM